MSASGQTQHLHLSQYAETDRPSYIDDYTDDMQRIDAGFNTAQSNALTALQRCTDNAGDIQDLSSRVGALEQSKSDAGGLVYEIRKGNGPSGSVATTSQGRTVSLTFPTSVSSSGETPWDIGVDAVFTLPVGDYIIQVSADILHNGYASAENSIILMERGVEKAAAPGACIGPASDGVLYIATLCSTVHVSTATKFAVTYSFAISDVTEGATYTIVEPSLSIISLTYQQPKGISHV